MGVYGLWRLLDATGKQVPLETLEGKVLAIDVSIWIHQVLQGYQDRFGNPKPNAHLIGLFSRICKLLYYKIKPVFVFDGGVPLLKKDTIALRRKQKCMAKNKAQQMRTELINNLLKHSTVKTVLNPEDQNATNTSAEIVLKLQSKTVDDMFKLPDMPSTSKAELSISDDYESDSSSESSPRKQTKWVGNIHNVNVASAEFKGLPADVRYDILTDLKETRKQNSWGRLHEMPDETHEFSGFQMKRLLKRRLVQQSLESAEKEMGGKTLTLDELDKLLTEQGIATSDRDCDYRIAGDSTTRLIYISDKNAYFKNSSNDVNSKNKDTLDTINETDEPVAESSKAVPICEDINEYEFDDDWGSDIEIPATSNSQLYMDTSSDSETEIELNESQPLSKKYFGKHNMNPALAYMLEYSGLTEKQIITLLEQNKKEAFKDTKDILKPLLSKVSFKTPNCENTDNGLNMQQSASTSKDDKVFEIVDSMDAMKSFPISKTESAESNTESNISLPPVAASTISSIKPMESTEVTAVSSTDSDSDDFIEIEDVPIPVIDTAVSKSALPQAIEITFKSNQAMENDMFADVFEVSDNESNVKTSLNVSSSSENPEKLVKSFPDRQEMQDKVISEKPMGEVVTDEVEDKELLDATGMDNVEVQSTENDIDIKDTRTQQEKTEPIETKNVEIGNDSETSSAEVTRVNIPTDPRRISPIPVTDDELLTLKARLEDEQTELMANIGKLERQGINISQRIRVEAQELLRLFGIPYVVAPMEAEAQCAYLEQVHLTDGTITDDSDIWLFGGQCVYKNFFDHNKKVLQYRLCDIQHHFKLTRNEMIRLALLVGSDYTVGLTGIGPVTALEILAAFPSQGDDLLQGLTNFCWWMKSGRSAGPGRTTLRNKVQNLEVHKGFPSQAVVQAYLFPEVDESKEGFTWGKPNTMILSNYAKEKFGWTKLKFDEIMAPVLKRLEEKQNQKLIDTYFKLQAVPKPIEMTMSKRVQKAVQRLNNKNPDDSGIAESTQGQSMRTKWKSANENRKKKRESSSRQKKESTSPQSVIVSDKPSTCNVTVGSDTNIEEHIPQREKDKANSLKKKLHAIEVLRKSKKGLNKTKKVKRCVRKVKDKAGLSESDSASS